MRFGLALLALVLSCAASVAQDYVMAWPVPVNNTNVSSTIASTNVFQVLLGQVTTGRPRFGCMIVNNSVDRQWVYFGPATDTPSKAKAIPIEPAAGVNALGGFVSCSNSSGGVSQDQIWITGTTTDTFIATYQQ